MSAVAEASSVVLIAIVLLSRLIWIVCAWANPTKATLTVKYANDLGIRIIEQPPELAAEE
jgi:hypothetical protein